MQSLRKKDEEKATLGADCHCLKDMAGLQALLSKGYLLGHPEGRPLYQCWTKTNL